jgi:hypothetical protein
MQHAAANSALIEFYGPCCPYLCLSMKCGWYLMICWFHSFCEMHFAQWDKETNPNCRHGLIKALATSRTAPRPSLDDFIMRLRFDNETRRGET